MLKLSKFADYCGIPPDYEEEMLNLENVVNWSLECHMYKWREKLKNLVQEDMWKFDCLACYNTSDLKNSELYESIEKSLSIELNFQNDSKIDGESNSHQGTLSELAECILLKIACLDLTNFLKLVSIIELNNLVFLVSIQS